MTRITWIKKSVGISYSVLSVSPVVKEKALNFLRLGFDDTKHLAWREQIAWPGMAFDQAASGRGGDIEGGAGNHHFHEPITLEHDIAQRREPQAQAHRG